MAGREKATAEAAQTHSALVPKGEQPYPLPGNWAWVRLGSLLELHRGVTYKKEDVCGGQDEGATLVLRGGNIKEDGSLDLFCDDAVYVPKERVSSLQLIQEGDIVVVSSTGSAKVIGRAGIAPASYEDVAFGAFLTLARPLSAAVKQYVGLFFLSQEYRNAIRRLAKGVNINNLRNAHIAHMPFPLPPLPEQQRIVNLIDSLFEQLDHGRQLVQAALDSFEARRAAILHKAFSGGLTAQWRAKQGAGMDSWTLRRLDEIGEIVTGSTPSRGHPQYYGGKTPFIKPTELNQGRYMSQSAESLSDLGKAVSRPIRAGSTCVCCIGSIGKCGFLLVDGVTNQQINAIMPHSGMCDLYVYYYCCSSQFKQALLDHSSSTTLSIINKKRMSALTIPLPPLAEQREIVGILDELLSSEQAARDKLEPLLEQIDLMKKSILACAFRGKLGTHDPGEAGAAGVLS